MRAISLILLLAVVNTAAAVDIETPATITPARAVDMAAKVASRVNGVFVEEGDGVRAGTTLVTLDSAELKARHASAEAEAALARAELRRAKRAESRARTLFENKTLPEENFDNALYAREAAEQRVRAAEARIDLMEAELGETIIKAPFDGVVTFRDVEIGQLTEVGRTLFTIEDHGHLEVSFKVSDRDVTSLVPGRDVTVVVDALARASLAATIVRIVPSGDRQTHEFRVEATLAPRDGLMPGMFASVRIAR